MVADNTPENRFRAVPPYSRDSGDISGEGHHLILYSFRREGAETTTRHQRHIRFRARTRRSSRGSVPANLSQQGGSALTIQSGDRFDAIVFGERARGRWMAGSNFFQRTQPNQNRLPRRDGRRPDDGADRDRLRRRRHPHLP